MSILLQSVRTDKYLITPGQWTELPELACEFAGGPEAVMFCYEHHLEEMRILGRFEDPERDFTIPLTESKTE